jgi:uncharacterized protein (TIGR01777 family)
MPSTEFLKYVCNRDFTLAVNSNRNEGLLLYLEAIMRVIITGGTGLIGRALAADLLKDGHEVIVLSRDPQGHRPNLPSGVRLEQWDGRSAQGWGHLVEQSGVIVNLAGENIGERRWTEARKRALIESRLQAGKAVSEAVAQARIKPGLLVQASAVGYYGSHMDEIITEMSPPADDFMSRICQQCEPATASVEQAGVRRVVVRSGVVLSRQGGAFPRMLMPFNFCVGGPLGSGQQWLSWIHLRDEVAGLRFLMDSPYASGVYNLSSPHPLKNLDFERAIGRVLHRPAFIPTPAFAIWLLFGEMAITVLGGQRVVPERLEKEAFVFNFPRIDEALMDLLAKS